MKLIDQQGKPSPLATKWRDDKEYPSVCQAMLKASYPPGLHDAAPSVEADKDAASRWFANETSAGKNAVGRMVAFYAMLQEGAAGKSIAPNRKSRPSPTPSGKSAPASTWTRATHESPSERNVPVGESKVSEPSVHINLQIHISPDASSDQIKEIFSNIAKYIYTKT